VAAMQLSRTHRILVGVVVTGAVIIAGIGFAGSYAAVRALAEKKGFGEFSLVFPIGIDAGICVLLSLDLLLTWIRIPFPLLRQAAWVLTAATIAFNGAAAWPDPLGVGMHAVIPLLFIVTVEAARHAVGRIADITADKHMEGVRLTRWLLSPIPTFKLWRRMKLWELRSYEQVIKLEQDRLIYQSRLQARFGRGWRRRAPIESLMPLRLAKYGVPLADTASAGLAAAGIETAPVASAPLAPATAVAELPTAGTLTTTGTDAGTETSQDTRDAGAAGQRPMADVTAPAHDLTKRHQQGPVGEQGQGQGQGQQAQDQTQAEAEARWRARMQAQPQAQLRSQQQPAYQAQQAQQQWAQEEWQQEGYPAQDVSPWFAAPAVPEGAYEGAYNPTYVEGLEPTPVMVPSGPGGRNRPLGGAPGVTVPGQRQEEQYPPYQQGPQQPVDGPAAPPAARSGDQAPQVEGERDQDETQGPTVPEDMSRDEAYFNAYRKYVSENGDLPNARQFGLYLMDLYGITGRSGGPLTESTLRTPLRELRHRYQRDLDAETDEEAEHIA
jgi:hypothetical protein